MLLAIDTSAGSSVAIVDSAAGIRVETASPLDLTIFIAADSAQQLADTFKKEWSGLSWTTCGNHTKNMVRLGGVCVAWLTPVKEQNQ